MFPPKKKPGLDVGIIIGKPGAKKPPADDIGDPGPLDGPEAEAPDDEASETPQEEGAEDYGAKLISDIEAAGEKHGMDAPATHALAADLFEAMAKCLRGDDGGDDMGAPPLAPGGMPPMPGGRYGR